MYIYTVHFQDLWTHCHLQVSGNRSSEIMLKIMVTDMKTDDYMLDMFTTERGDNTRTEVSVLTNDNFFQQMNKLAMIGRQRADIGDETRQYDDLDCSTSLDFKVDHH